MKITAAVKSASVAKGLSEIEFNGACVMVPVVVEGLQATIVIKAGDDVRAKAILAELQRGA